MSRFFRWILNNRWPILSVISLLTIIFLFPLSRLHNDNSISVWLDKDGADYVNYEKFVKEFQVQDFIIAAVEGFDYSEKTSRQLINSLSGNLRKTEGVQAVYHLNELSLLFPGQEEKLRGLFVSKDEGVYAFWIKPVRDQAGNMQGLINNINAVLTSGLPERAAYHLAGPPVLNSALDQASNSQAAIFFPLVICLSAVVLLILFRDLKALFICFSVAAVTQIWSLALISMTGHTMNMVMTTLPPLLWVLSLSSLIYMVHSVKVERDIEKAALKVFKPCSLTAITTAFGFLSLALSHVGPVREMGIFTFIGMFISLFLSFTLAPVLLSMIRVRDEIRPKTVSQTSTPVFAEFLSKNTTSILIIAALITAAGVFYTFKINMDTNNLNFFKKDSQIYRDYMFIGQRLTGHAPLEVVFELPEGMLLEEAVDMSNKLKKELLPLAGVKQVITPSTFHGLVDSDSEKYVNEDSTKIRISVLTDYISTNATQGLINRIKKTIDQHLTQYPQIKYSVTGVVQLLVRMQDELLKTQVKSFSLAFVFIAFIFYVLFRSVPFAIIAVVPNIFPIAVTLGLMGLLDIPLNVATIMIASIAIGIAVDDTIHIMVRYREYHLKSMDSLKAIESTWHDVGRPVVFATLINTIGFGVLMFSDFMPIKYFGVLMVLTLLSALLAEFILLPALLIGGSKWING